MKKVNTEVIEKMAKQKNIDKDQIEKIADGYKGKSESELMDELVKIGKTLEGKEEVVSKLKTFLDDGQRKKIDAIMNKISDAEAQSKTDSKKSKSKKNTNIDSTSQEKKSQKSKSNENNSTATESDQPSSTKKTKKVIRKVKKSSTDSN
ncbi:hypothetical protein [Romboutsia sp.]|uniref:hypothetical protein n=1 Tax=Romboutsia sp. TaxID=1965302 RepID=UPI003F35695B